MPVVNPFNGLMEPRACVSYGLATRDVVVRTIHCEGRVENLWETVQSPKSAALRVKKRTFRLFSFHFQ